MLYMRIAPAKASRRVPPAIVERKARFRIALAHARMTAGQWADAEGITPSYLSHFLAGRHESKRLDEKIAAFIAKQSRNVA